MMAHETRVLLRAARKTANRLGNACLVPEIERLLAHYGAPRYPVGQEPLSGTLRFPDGTTRTFDSASVEEVNAATAPYR